MQRRALQSELRVNQFQVLLTTYEYIIKDRPVLSKMKWIHMIIGKDDPFCYKARTNFIIDEGHRMKNTQSKLAQTLTTYYHSRYRLILTGTPLQNNLPELWSLLNFVLPKIFNSVKSFDEWFNTPFANSGTPDKIELNEEEALLIIRRLHKVLRPFLLRRLKKDVESELPDKVEKVIKVKMSALQAQLYKQMKKYKMIADGNDKPGYVLPSFSRSWRASSSLVVRFNYRKTSGVRGLSNELMQLRKICQHPFLFDSVEDKINPAGLIDDKLIRTSGKIELLSRILPKFFATGHRVRAATFTSMRSVAYFQLGSHLFPDDEGHGYHGRLPQNDGMEVLASRWWYKDRRARWPRAAFQREGLGIHGLHPFYQSWWSRSEPTDGRYSRHL